MNKYNLPIIINKDYYVANSIDHYYCNEFINKFRIDNNYNYIGIRLHEKFNVW